MRPLSLARVLAAASAVVLFTGACQTSAPEATPTSTPPATPVATASAPGSVQPGQTETPSATSEASPSSPPQGTPTVQPSSGEGEVEIGPGTFFLADPQVGLDALTSYTETLTVSFNGTADGQAAAWSKSYRLQHTAQPAASVLTIEASGDAETPDPAALAEATGTAYQRDANGTCSAKALDPANSMLASREPANELPGLMGAEEAGSETANGVVATHYTFDGRALLESSGPVTTGEVWVAADGGYVVKYQRHTTGDATYFGGGLAGEMTWDYELSDINALTGVTLPDGCQLDVPIMTGASNVLSLPRYAGFDTQSSIADVMSYYEEQLSGLGWDFTEPFKGEDRAVVEFTKGDQVLNLLITPGENGHRVDLALSSSG